MTQTTREYNPVRRTFYEVNYIYASGDDVRCKQYRKKIYTMIRLSKRIFYDTLFEKNMANLKKIWQGINELLYQRKKNFKVISALKDFNNRNKIVKLGSRIPDIINEHFATVAGNRLANKLIIPQNYHLDYVDKSKSLISSFFFQPVLFEEVRQKYYLYRMINPVVLTPRLPNYSNV